MSQEKKALAGAAYGAAAAREAERAAPSADSSPPASNDAASPEADATAGRRGRAPAVLPGILGKQLRAAYGELLSSPVPDRFNDLIKQLERQEAMRDGSAEPQAEETNE